MKPMDNSAANILCEISVSRCLRGEKKNTADTETPRPHRDLYLSGAAIKEL